MVVEAGILVVIEIVQEADDAPEVFVAFVLAGVGAHASLDREGVLAQTF